MEIIVFWNIVWRRKWIVLQCFLIVFLTAAVGTSFLPKRYKSTSRVFYEKSLTAASFLENIGIKAVTLSQTATDDLSLENHVTIATSTPLLDRVILTLQLTDGKGELLKAKELIKPGLLKKIHIAPFIKVENVDDTSLFEIVSSSTDPEEAAMISDTIAEECVKNHLENKAYEYKKAETFIENSLEGIRDKYISSLNILKTFNIDEKSLDLDSEIKNIIARLSSLMVEKKETIIQIAEAQSVINTLQRQLNEQSDENIFGSTSEANDYISELRNNILAYEMKLEETLVEKTKSHPDIKILEYKLEKARSELSREIVLSKKYSTELLNKKRALVSLKAHLNTLEAEIENLDKTISVFPEKQFTNSQIRLEIDVNKGLYQSMLQYFYQIRVARLSLFPDLRIVEYATVSEIDDPDSPNFLVNVLIGMFMGGLLGLSMALLADYMDDTIKSRMDIKQIGMRLLGTVPKFNKRQMLKNFAKSHLDPLYECYRTIRNNLEFLSRDKLFKTVLVTSALKGEGKSTTVINLAVSFASQGKNVLLLDADFRQPILHKALDMDNRVGAAELLLKQIDMDDVIRKSGIESLSVVTSGKITSDPARLVESEEMKTILKELSGKFDMVIIDSPSILETNDPVVIARMVDLFVLVVETGREKTSVFNLAMDSCKMANIEPAGIVLNKYR
ncbi:putative Non-specific protein-tyrosine kinase [Desulfamplus magnetovallimortis]|uniref:non-specific protein-tyrosine kinase n=1 Tax=Desulfamplus magnetovallimortis TaxID=1246637 RepID=A0A1W1HDA0_9BACT|nr:polysaccharide biosynthesis tyrosine autokinase [Desulfamplus magnetovallimortis]SLM30403.1 putative Non-specific protein-tyrosine kinase [Desulfamplus magnetovallimortis]